MENLNKETGDGRGKRTGEETRTVDIRAALERIGPIKVGIPRLSIGEVKAASAPTSPLVNVSVMDLTWDEDEARSIKRKRSGERAEVEETAVTDGNRLATKIRITIKELDREIRNIAKHARDKNTKCEIKSSAAKANTLISILMTNEVQEILQKLGRNDGAGLESNEKTGPSKMAKNEEKSKVYSDMGTQTVSPLEIQALEEIGKIKSYEDFTRVKRKDWPSNFYKLAFVTKGSPLKDRHDADVLALEEVAAGEVVAEKEGILKRFEEKYPELKSLSGKLSVLKVTSSMENSAGIKTEKTKLVLKAEIDDSREDWFNCLVMIKTRLVSEKRERIMMYPPKWDNTGAITRLMAECIFNETGIKCIICIKGINAGLKIPDRNEESQRKKEKENNKEVLLISKDGVRYADLLKTVKGQMAGMSGISPVDRIRKTNKGDLLIEAKKEDIRDLNRKFENIIEGATVKILGSAKDRIKIQVADIDADTSDAALMSELEKNVDLEKAAIKIEVVRPAFGETRTATISLEKNEGTKLLKKGRIKVGVVSCRIREFIAIKRCFKCWGYDHVASQCKGPDRSKLCLRCGKPGHEAANCAEVSFCPLCGKLGHRAGSGACPKMKLMMRQIRTKRKTKGV